MDKTVERLKYFIVESKAPLYIDKNIFKSYFYDEVSIKLSCNCSDSELYGDAEKPNWYKSLLNRKDEEITILEIDADNSTKEEQQRFISLVKDKTIMSYHLFDATKILIYSSNIDIIDNELKGLLVVV